jgi:pimeloyl-ACP methyl ester carboxylesterase
MRGDEDDPFRDVQVRAAGLVAHDHFVARMTAVQHPTRVRGVVLAAASAKDKRERLPHVWATPTIAGDLTLPDEARLAAPRLGLFADANDPAAWLKGWHPAVSKTQREDMLPQSVWWWAGVAPSLEFIPEDNPFKPRDRWEELKGEYGARVSIVTVPKASHALFPEQPLAVAGASEQ